MTVTLTVSASNGQTTSLALPNATVNASAEPNATTTGAKGTMTSYTGSYTVSGSNVLIENKILSQSLRVTGTNVTVKNCRLTGSGWGLDAEGSNGLKVQNCTILAAGQAAVLCGENTLVEYCDIATYDNGILLAGVTATLQYNYIHDLHPGSIGQAHVDGIQMSGGQNGVLIKGNSIRGWDTSCVFIKCDYGANYPIRNVTVDGNWLRNQSGKTTAAAIYVYDNQATCTNIVVSNNVIERGYAGTGYCSWDTTTARNQTAWTNNKDMVSGAVIPKP